MLAAERKICLHDGMEEICANIIKGQGGPGSLAAKLVEAGHGPITSQAVSQWKRVPPGRVIQIETLTGISRHQIRPDIFGETPIQAAE